MAMRTHTESCGIQRETLRRPDARLQGWARVTRGRQALTEIDLQLATLDVRWWVGLDDDLNRACALHVCSAQHARDLHLTPGVVSEGSSATTAWPRSITLGQKNATSSHTRRGG